MIKRKKNPKKACICDIFAEREMKQLWKWLISYVKLWLIMRKLMCLVISLLFIAYFVDNNVYPE